MHLHPKHWPVFPVQPEIISIHIPKTAGSTFAETLRSQYGWRLKHLYLPKDWIAFERSKPFFTSKPNVKAIHGHLHHLNREWKTLYPNGRWVIWLRDPTERVISAYYHWLRPIDHQDPHHRLFAQKQPDLLTFVREPEFFPTTRVYQPLLQGFEPEDFFFVGRTSHYDHDLKELARRLHWTEAPSVKANVNPDKPLLDEGLKQIVRQELESEYHIYNKFCPET
jgi:hypothetical protein